MGAAAGIFAPIIGFTCVLSAIASYPQFSLTNNALSDLGIVSGVTGQLFNLGFITCGLLTLVFAIVGLFAYFEKSRAGITGAVFFAAAALTFICIGIFNENWGEMHNLANVAFFVLVLISTFFNVIAFAVGHQSKMALLTFAVAVVAAIPWILYFTIHYVPNDAIPAIHFWLSWFTMDDYGQLQDS